MRALASPSASREARELASRWLPVGVLALLAVGLASSAPSPAIALGLAVAPVGTWLAYRRPGGLLAGLILLLLGQDWLVLLGLGWLQPADEALVLAGTLGLLLHGLREGRPIRTPLDLPMLLLALCGLAATILRAIPAPVALLGGLSIFKGLLAWQLAARWRPDRIWLERFLRLLALLATGLGLVALLQRLAGRPVYALTGQLAHFETWAGGKTPSLFFNHNALGHVMVYGGALCLGLALAGRRSVTDRGERDRAGAGRGGGDRIGGDRGSSTTPGGMRSPTAWLPWAGLLCLAGLLVSASREGWIGAAFGLMLAAASLRSRRLLRIGLLTSLLLGAGGLSVYSSSEDMQAELARRWAGVGAGWRDYQLGFSGWQFRGEYRVYALLKSQEVWRDHAWLGTGPGRFGGQVALRYPSPIYEDYRFLPLDGSHQPLDIFWARLLAEWGLLGGAAYLAAFALALLAFRRAARSGDPLARALGLGGIVAWGALSVFGFFAPALEDPLTAIPFWAWAGLAWRLSTAADG